MNHSQTDIQKEPVILNQEIKETLTGALNNPMQSMRSLVKSSLFMFMRYFWDTYSQDKFIPNWHIEQLCNELEIIARRVARNEKKEYDLIINIPPGTTKTATVSIMFPVWCWVNWHWMRFITTSHSSTLSLESAEYSRDIIRSDKFKQMFPDVDIKQDKDAKSNFRVVKMYPAKPGFMQRIQQGGGRISTSVDARIIGFHAHIIIADDLIDSKRSLSEVGLRTANEHIDHTLSTRKVDKKVTPLIMIMQRLHQNDPTGHILAKKKKNVKHISLPGEIRNYKEYLKPAEWAEFYQGDLLDADRLSWEVLQDLEMDLGQYAYAGQIGQNPTPPGGGMFKVDRIPVVNALSSETNIVRTVRYWDKAGTADGGAYTAGVKISIFANGTFVIQDVKRGQWSSEVREQIIRITAEADGRKCEIYIEQEPGSGGKESAESSIRNLAGFTCRADRPTGDKVFRADPFSVQVNNGNVRMMRADWNKPFTDELQMFPNGTYKDQVDAASAAFNQLAARRVAKVYDRNKRR